MLPSIFIYTQRQPKWCGRPPTAAFNCYSLLKSQRHIYIYIHIHILYIYTYRKSNSFPILLSMSLNFHLALISSHNVARPFFDDKLQRVEDLQNIKPTSIQDGMLVDPTPCTNAHLKLQWNMRMTRPWHSNRLKPQAIGLPSERINGQRISS